MFSYDTSDDDFDADIASLEPSRRERLFRPRRLYDVSDPISFRQLYRMPIEAVNYLEEQIGHELESQTNRNHPLTPREKILSYLNFLGGNLYYHNVKNINGPSSSTICRIVKDVTNVILSWEEMNPVIRWPANVLEDVVRPFKDIAGMPAVVGAIDGTHEKLSPPTMYEEAYINRHHDH